MNVHTCSPTIFYRLCRCQVGPLPHLPLLVQVDDLGFEPKGAGLSRRIPAHIWSCDAGAMTEVELADLGPFVTPQALVEATQRAGVRGVGVPFACPVAQALAIGDDLPAPDERKARVIEAAEVFARKATA